MNTREIDKRVFIAVKVYPSDNMIDVAGELKNLLKNEKIRWVVPGNYHITLHFLGQTSTQKIKEIETSLQSNIPGYHDFKLTIESIGVFRSLSWPRVIWAGIRESNDLTELHRMVTNALNQAGYELNSSSYSPHITLGRMKRIKDREKFRELVNSWKDRVFMKTEVESIVLFESVSGSGGVQYHPLNEFFF